MEYLEIMFVIVSSYLLGSISFARVVLRIVDPNGSLEDIEFPIDGTDESMTMSAMGGNTVSMKYGSRAGCTVGLLDILKVLVPTLAFKLIYPDQYYVLLAAIAGFIGHCWPIYYRFKGGRGMSAFYGGLFAIDPIGAIAVAVFGLVIGMAVFRDMLIAYMAGFWLVIPWMWFTTKDFNYLAYALIMNVLFVLAMIPELREIIRLRKLYGKGDMSASMQQFPMGRHMLKMMNFLNLSKKSGTSK